MTLVTIRYMRKPSFVDAVRVTAKNFAEVCVWCDGEIVNDDGKQYIRVRAHNPQKIRHTQAFLGDWVLYTDQGYRVFTDKAFGLTFDKVSIYLKEEESSTADAQADDLLGDPQPMPILEAHCNVCDAKKDTQSIGEQCNLPRLHGSSDRR